MKILISLLLVLSFSATGNEGDLSPEELAAQQKPALSDLGKRRAKQNLERLQNSLRDLQANVEGDRKNVETIEREISKLDAFEKERQGLKKEILGFLDRARKEVQKNDAQIKELERYEASQSKLAKSVSDPSLKESIERSRIERAEKEKWRSNSLQSMKEVEGSLRENEKLRRELAFQRDALVQKLKDISPRLQGWEKRKGGLVKKKEELEGMMSQ